MDKKNFRRRNNKSPKQSRRLQHSLYWIANKKEQLEGEIFNKKLRNK